MFSTALTAAASAKVIPRAPNRTAATSAGDG
jgi:hypothetical protein